MTATERKQRERDRRKAGLVLVSVWVPADKEAEVRQAVADIIAPVHVSDDVAKAVQGSPFGKAAAAQNRAVAQLEKEST